MAKKNDTKAKTRRASEESPDKADSTKDASPALDRRQRRSKAAIRTAFTELLEEKDLSSITVTEIARRADRDRKTFYLHYDSIEALVDELLREEVERMSATIEKASLDSEGRVDVPELFEVLALELEADFNRSPGIVRHVESEQLVSRIRPMLVDNIVAHDSLGLAHSLGPYLELFVTYFCAGLLALFHRWMSTDSELPMDTLADLAASATAGGMALLSEKANSLKVAQQSGEHATASC